MLGINVRALAACFRMNLLLTLKGYKITKFTCYIFQSNDESFDVWIRCTKCNLTCLPPSPGKFSPGQAPPPTLNPLGQLPRDNSVRKMVRDKEIVIGSVRSQGGVVEKLLDNRKIY